MRGRCAGEESEKFLASILGVTGSELHFGGDKWNLDAFTTLLKIFMDGEEKMKFEELIIGFLPAMLYLIKQY